MITSYLNQSKIRATDLKNCNSCGKCCIKYSNGALDASAEEIDYWGVFRPHIAKYIDNQTIWVDPQSKKSLTRCPFLKESETSTDKQPHYLCDIYFDRPDDCKVYPTSISEMLNDECEMIESIDLKDTDKAQKKLDDLMNDSRPAWYRPN